MPSIIFFFNYENETYLELNAKANKLKAKQIEQNII